MIFLISSFFDILINLKEQKMKILTLNLFPSLPFLNTLTPLYTHKHTHTLFPLYSQSGYEQFLKLEIARQSSENNRKFL